MKSLSRATEATLVVYSWVQLPATVAHWPPWVHLDLEDVGDITQSETNRIYCTVTLATCERINVPSCHKSRFKGSIITWNSYRCVFSLYPSGFEKIKKNWQDSVCYTVIRRRKWKQGWLSYPPTALPAFSSSKGKKIIAYVDKSMPHN